MGPLRKRLAETIPELADALERSWHIAFDEWLAAMSPQMDSYNAYPHLRNHEKHLERIWHAYEKHHGPSALPLLSPVEIYVMLSSILFHDIGRTLTGPYHGEASKVIIENHRAALGIPSAALAKTIARISRFHDLPPARMASNLQELSITSVDPYGEIRENACAALLTLIDYMDGTLTRVVPDYLKSRPDLGPVGAFRRVIRDVEIDLEGQLVKAVLGDDFEKDEHRVSVEDRWNVAPSFERYSTNEIAARLVPGKTPEPVVPRPEPADVSRLAETPTDEKLDTLGEFRRFNSRREEPLSLFKRISNAPATNEQKLVARQYGYAQPLLKGGREPTKTATLSDEDLLNLLRNEEIQKQAAKILGRETIRTISSETKKIPGSANPELFAALRKNIETVVQLGMERTTRTPELLLATILGNIQQNDRTLQAIRQTLWTVGLPVRAWLVEWKEHLYDQFGEEVFEPMLSAQDLFRTFDVMVSLATRIVGKSAFSYASLA